MKSFGLAKHADYYSACGSIWVYDLKAVELQTDFYKSPKTLIQNHITILSILNEMTSCLTVTHPQFQGFGFGGKP